MIRVSDIAVTTEDVLMVSVAYLASVAEVIASELAHVDDLVSIRLAHLRYCRGAVICPYEGGNANVSVMNGVGIDNLKIYLE